MTYTAPNTFIAAIENALAAIDLALASTADKPWTNLSLPDPEGTTRLDIIRERLSS